MTGSHEQQLLTAITHLETLLDSVLSGSPDTHPSVQSWQLIKTALLRQFGQHPPSHPGEQTLADASVSRDFRQVTAILEGDRVDLGASSGPDAREAKQAALALRQAHDELARALQEIRSRLDQD